MIPSYCSACSTTIWFYLLLAANTLLCITGFASSSVLRRKAQACPPDAVISIESDVFRWCRGMGWTYSRFQITAKDLLKHWHGICVGRGMGCRLQAVSSGSIQDKACMSISRRHARLNFDCDRQQFYIEDAGSQNKTRWAPLNGSHIPEGKLLEGRKYLTEDTRIWLGSVQLDLRLRPLENAAAVKEPGNTVGAWSAVVLQLIGIVFCTGHIGGFTITRCIPGLLMGILALQVLYYDRARNPAPGFIFAALTYAWVLYVSFSGSPDGAALTFSRALFCIGTAVVCLLPDASGPNAYSFDAGAYFKAGGSVALVALLYHYEIISTFNDAVFLFAFILARQSKNWRDMVKGAL